MSPLFIPTSSVSPFSQFIAFTISFRIVILRLLRARNRSSDEHSYSYTSFYDDHYWIRNWGNYTDYRIHWKRHPV